MAFPTITHAAIGYSTGASLAPTLPAHSINDILLVTALQGAANPVLTCSTSGWAGVSAQPATNSFIGSHIFWKRATSSSEPPPTISSAPSGHFFVKAYCVSGCIITGTPWENSAWLGPLSQTNNALRSSPITTVDSDRLVICFALLEDDLVVATPAPPSGWTLVVNDPSASGTDARFITIRRNEPAPISVAAANPIETYTTSDDLWHSWTTAFIPVPVTSSRLKRWNGSAWVVANLKRHDGSIWVPKSLKKF